LKFEKKKLERLEENFSKKSTELKNITKDKNNIENFLKTIFPKEMHDTVIKTEAGMYDSNELGKMWLVCDSKNQNEFSKILEQVKSENRELKENISKLTKELQNMTNEYANFKKTHSTSMEQLSYYSNNYSDLVKKSESLEVEKNYLMKLLEEKNSEIESLIALEVENAELKAKSLLATLDSPGETHLDKKKSGLGNMFGTENINSESPEKSIKIVSLNASCQTLEQIYTSEHVSALEKQILDYKQRIEKIKKDLNDYKEKSHKVMLMGEENYKKILQENENLKKEIAQLHENHSKTLSESTAHKEEQMREMFMNSNNASMIQQGNVIKMKLHPREKLGTNITEKNFTNLNPNFNIVEIEQQKVSIEYLKNVLIKYLEAISIGNEFQIKILENVLFTILNVSHDEKDKLEEKRMRSSFYYNLWYNAKAFLSAKIYGTSFNENPESTSKRNSAKDLPNINNYKLNSSNISEVKSELETMENRTSFDEMDIKNNKEENQKQMINEI
jgi:hypothetical protein